MTKKNTTEDNVKVEYEPCGYIYYHSEDHQVFSLNKKDWHESGTGLWTEIPLFKKKKPNGALNAPKTE